MSGDRPLRILHLANSLSNRGNGIVNVAVDLAMEQANRGDEVVFASGGGGYEQLLEEHKVHCVELPVNLRGGPLRSAFSLFHLIRTFRPDVVHAHTRLMLLQAWPCTKPLRIPLLMSLHNVHDKAGVLLQLCDRVIAVSAAVKQHLVAEGIPPQKIDVVLNGTIGTRRAYQTSGKVELQHPAVVTVAGMMHRKGIAELLHAFHLVAQRSLQVHLYLVGGGTEQQLFERVASQGAGADRIHFTGFQPDPTPYLRAADIFVLASRRESFGLAILEARQAGCAIIGTAVDGIPELLEAGRCGLLVPPESPDALASAIDELLQNEPLRDELGRRAQAGLQQFRVERMADEVMSVYQQLLLRSKLAQRAVSHVNG